MVLSFSVEPAWYDMLFSAPQLRQCPVCRHDWLECGAAFLLDRTVLLELLFQGTDPVSEGLLLPFVLYATFQVA